MGLKEDMIGEWARHYDTLLWTITYIFLALDGALLVHCSEDGKFRTLLALGGISLNFITVNLVASVRELRHRIGGRMDEAVKESLHEGRKLYQWSFFIFIFVLI